MRLQFTTKDTERFWSKVDASGDCWLWTAYKQPPGYGKFGWNGKPHYAHRIAYQMLVGPIPADRELDHLCRVRHCVNPDHLRVVTHRQNTLCGYGPSARESRLTHCPAGHPYDKTNTYIQPDGWRQCRACHRIREHNRQTRLHSAKHGIREV